MNLSWLDDLEQNWRDTALRKSEGNWKLCGEILERFGKQVNVKPLPEEVRSVINEWIRIATNISNRYSIDERLRRWPTVIDHLPEEVQDAVLSVARDVKRRLADLVKSRELIRQVIDGWKRSESWYLRERMTRDLRDRDIDIENTISDLKREGEPVDAFESDCRDLQRWIAGLDELSSRISGIVQRLRAAKPREAAEIIKQISASVHRGHPVVADFQAGLAAVSIPWISGDFLAEILELHPQRRYWRAQEFQSLLPSSAKPSSILTQYITIQSYFGDVLKVALEKLVSGRPDDAIEDINKASALCPECPEIRVVRAKCELMQLSLIPASGRC